MSVPWSPELVSHKNNCHVMSLSHPHLLRVSLKPWPVRFERGVEPQTHLDILVGYSSAGTIEGLQGHTERYVCEEWPTAYSLYSILTDSASPITSVFVTQRVSHCLSYTIEPCFANKRAFHCVRIWLDVHKVPVITSSSLSIHTGYRQSNILHGSLASCPLKKKKEGKKKIPKKKKKIGKKKDP